MLKRPNTPKHRMAPRLKLSSILLPLLIGLVPGVSTMMIGCKKQAASAPKTVTERWIEHTQHIPKGASLTLFAADLNAIKRAHDIVAPRTPKGAFASCDAWKQQTPFDLCDSKTLTPLGINDDGGALLMMHDDHWAVSLSTDDANALLGRLERLKDATQKATWTIAKHPHGVWDISSAGSATAVLHAIAHEHTIILVPNRAHDAWGAKQIDTRAWATKQAQMPASNAWVNAPRHRALIDDLLKDKALIVGSVRPQDWLLMLAADSTRAQRLKQQMVDQADTVGFSLKMDQKTQRLTFRVLSKEVLTSATSVRSLDGGDGELPQLGHLIPAGTLGVVRLSADPKQLERYISSLLSPKQRDDLKTYQKKLKDEFALELQEQVIDNVRGHAVAAIYGVEPQAWTDAKHPTDLLRRILTLQATREAVFVPLHDAQKFRDLLDAITQLSKGRLKRQRVPHGIHYAWMEERELKWAMVVYDHAMIILDSPAAFSRANKQAIKAAPLAASWQPKHLTPLLSGLDRAGFYIDLTLLSALVPQPYKTLLQPVFRAITSITVVSTPQDRGAETTIHMQLK